MNRIKIEIPSGIRFLSDWNEFKLSSFPGKCIINKQIPGCGFTEYCIRSNENIILCSPRKLLLKNKFDQHKNDVYLVINEMDKDPGVDKDLSKESKELSKQKDSYQNLSVSSKEIFQKLYSEIEEYKIKCFLKNRPMKILVTYDSYHIVVDILNKLNIFQYFYTVIDEFQSILHDARFKSDTELSFIECLKQSHSAIFVSATPMMDEYLEMLDEFRNLPYFELDWFSLDNSRVIRPSLKILTMKSVGTKAEEVIGKYLNGNFDRAVRLIDGKPIEIISDELVLYVNSVNHIISIIKKCNLKPEQCNILCSDTEDNKNKIKKKLGKNFSIGSVPLEGEKPKMFTFCTRTVYLGADFYSTCAKSVIFSDSNSDCLAVDISEDLPQILGRQRLFENPWKNQATFYYRTTADYKKMSIDDLKNIINSKRKKTEELISIYKKGSEEEKLTLAETYKNMARLMNYKDNYVAVNNNNSYLKPVFNNLVMVNEIRAFNIQQIDYENRFAVFSTIHNRLTKDDVINREVDQFLNVFKQQITFFRKMQLLCESGLSNDAINIILDQLGEDSSIKSYYLTLGPQRLRALSYNKTFIEKELGIIMFSQELLYDSIYSEFKEGNKLPLTLIKLRLENIYSSISYQSTPKATDICNYFEVKECLIPVEIEGKKKRVRGYELLKSKEQELRQELKHAE